MQVRPEEKTGIYLSSFPDSYRFSLELGREVEEAANARKLRPPEGKSISGREAVILEILPKEVYIPHMERTKKPGCRFKRKAGCKTHCNIK
jgi:hypothetical protein